MKNLIITVAVAVLIAMSLFQVDSLNATVSRGLYCESVLHQAVDFGNQALREGMDPDKVRDRVDRYLCESLEGKDRCYRAQVKHKGDEDVIVIVKSD